MEIRRNSIFAKILSKSNVKVLMDRSIRTAFISLEKNTIFLPDYDISDIAQYAILAHEVSHKMFTPKDEWSNVVKNEPHLKDILNIVEDYRIEVLIKRIYPGLYPFFHKGYKDIEEWFACDIDAHFFTKLNYFLKCNLTANFDISISFNADEMEDIEKVKNMSTFSDAVNIARYLYDKYFNDNFSLKDINQFIEVNFEGDSDLEADAPVVSSKNLLNTFNWPEINLKDHVKPLVELSMGKNREFVKYNKNSIDRMISFFNHLVETKNRLTNKNKRIGNLNVKMLPSFMVRDDLYDKKNVVKNVINHKFVIMIDLSGSMDGIFNYTIAQIDIMQKFCRKMRIPHEIYGFYTNDNSKLIFDSSAYIISIATDKLSLNKVKNNIMQLHQISLRSTPLSAALIVMEKIIKRIRETEMCQKLNLMIITDGGCDTQGKYYKHYVKSNLVVNTEKSFNDRMDSTVAIMKILKDLYSIDISVIDINDHLGYKDGIMNDTYHYFRICTDDIINSKNNIFIKNLIKEIL